MAAPIRTTDRAPGVPGIILSAPASGSGKTVLTLALLRHYARAGLAVAGAKVGPDYIDPAFHAAASGRPSINLDPWAMRPATLASAVTDAATGADLVLCEGVMGLFDGIGAGGMGSTADLALLTGWPVVLVVDVRGQAASAAATVAGFVRHRSALPVAGVIFNRVGGTSHARLVAESVAAACPELTILGAVPRLPQLTLPERHLGLVQAREHADLGRFLDSAADHVASHVDTAALRRLTRPASLSCPNLPLEDGAAAPLPPIGQRIAVASDDAFAFAYPAVLAGWRRAGAELIPFSPLADEAPDEAADAVYLPGGYPELHAGRLAAGSCFLPGLAAAAARGAALLGECGGYMVLGHGLIDPSGGRHAMAGLLPLETSLADRRLHLGYRHAILTATTGLGPAGARFRGHEFHYARAMTEGPGQPLFRVSDATGAHEASAGLVAGRIAGSFIHLIDRETA
ncbi:MAG: cobyrinate a,c-diamide synthase [Alphaproteobacteria bacterium]|nr:cobyrinate a,c-diamide synthase [Alphaproteobacteria bacterium]